MIRLVPLALVVVLLPLAVMATELKPPAAGIASAHPLATRAGHAILARGGNAFDAAVAMAATLAVVEPYSSGLGGGGFWLLHRARDGFETMVDARERAPLTATRDMYLDESGRPITGLSLNGPRAAAIPGLPAALVYVAEKYGRLPLKQSLAPAIRLAREGFAVTTRYRKLAERRMDVLNAYPAAAHVFLDNGFVPDPGFIVRQPDLAQTLVRLSKKGRAGFYAGETTKRLVEGVRAAGGIWNLKDLAGYRVMERTPVRGKYGNIRLTSAALPSSGGTVLMQMLNILEGFDLDKLDRVRRAQVIIEAMRLAYRDRARYLGDPDFVSVDTQRLLSRDYTARLRRALRMRVKSDKPRRRKETRETGTNTTHFSVIDREGNRVAVTLSINYAFGSGFMPPGTGVLLNNEMDDFVVKPGVPNVYGLVGAEANAIAPGKRPLSSMTPTFLETEDAVVVLGTPGGSRIITMVLLAALEFAHSRGGVEKWVALPRFHHQYLPDRVEYEPGAFIESEMHALEKLGHKLVLKQNGYGNMQAVVWYKTTNRIEAASDPRGQGLAKVE